MASYLEALLPEWPVSKERLRTLSRLAAGSLVVGWSYTGIVEFKHCDRRLLLS